MIKKNTTLSSLFYLVVLIFELPVISFLYLASPEYTDFFLLGLAILLAFLNTIIYFVVIKSDSAFENGFFKHSVFFLLGFLIVHFQYYAMYVLGFEDLDDMSIWINLSVVNKSSFISLMGYCTFLIGYILRKLYKSTIQSTHKNKELKSIKKTNVSLLNIGILISFFLFIDNVGASFLSGNYAGTYNWEEGATYYHILFDTLLKSVILQRSWDVFKDENNSKPSIKKYFSAIGFFPMAFVFMYLSLCIYIGDRGPLLIYSLLLVGCYLAITRLKINIAIWGIASFLAFNLMTFLVTVRSMDTSESFFLRAQKTLFTEKSQDTEKSELASSVRCLHLAVESVPSRVEYSQGLLLFYQLASSVPGASGAFIVFGGYMPWDLDSSTMISYWEGGKEFTSGSGTSSVADVYIDLGVFGVAVAFFICGYFFQYMESSLHNKTVNNVFLWIVIMTYLSNSFYLSRATLLYPIKEIIFVFILVLFNKLFTNLFNSSK